MVFCSQDFGDETTTTRRAPTTTDASTRPLTTSPTKRPTKPPTDTQTKRVVTTTKSPIPTTTTTTTTVKLQLALRVPTAGAELDPLEVLAAVKAALPARLRGQVETIEMYAWAEQEWGRGAGRIALSGGTSHFGF